MQITHEHARRLIQLRLDGGLQSTEKQLLSAHLHACSACEAYASGINEADALLRPLLKRHWSAQPVPLSIASLSGNSPRTQASTLLTIRMIAASLAFVALFVSVWQFKLPGPSTPSAIPLVLPFVPTPSAQTAQSTSTEFTFETCEMALYTVQTNDTLASIAERFLVLDEQLMELNRLNVDAVRPAMELVVPICNFAPTGTTHPATFTTTYTPILHSETPTPGG